MSTAIKDYYRILGVAPDAAAADIRSAYRKLAKRYHPDRNADPGAEDRFKEIGEAYDILKDERKRAAYDRYRSGGPFAGGMGGGFRSGDAEVSDLSDLFESLFGQHASAARRGPRPRRGKDREASLTIDLETACRGGKRAVGSGGRTLSVTLPAGATDGQKIRLRGQGEPGHAGGQPGDLILTIRVRPHPRFRVDGRDLHTRIAIAPWEAALGARIEVPTISGKLDMRVPAGSRSGQKLRARGHGMPGDAAGDLIVELLIQTPPADSEQLKELYRQLAAASEFDPRAE